MKKYHDLKKKREKFIQKSTCNLRKMCYSSCRTDKKERKGGLYEYQSVYAEVRGSGECL